MTMAAIDWDDINVGDFEFNDSKSFFARKHLSHESLEKQQEFNLMNAKMLNASLDDDSKSHELIVENKENIKDYITDNSAHIKLEPYNKVIAKTETVSSPADDKTPLAEIALKNNAEEVGIKCEVLSPTEINKYACASNEKFCINKVSPPSPATQMVCVNKTSPPSPATEVICIDKTSPPTPITEMVAVDKNSAESSSTAETNVAANSPNLFKSPLRIKTPDINTKSKKLSNIVCQWSSKKIIRTAMTTSSKCTTSRQNGLYNYKDVYQRKKEENLRKCLENERRMREFHSRPVPNFKATHKKLEQQRVHAVTVPQSPAVLKKSREMMERKMNKLEEIKRKQQPPKFEHRSPVVLKEEPFVPKKSQTQLQQCPFNLHTDKRLQERKQFDVAVQKQSDEKRKQKEEERKKREEERVKELRKLATFKARPNPFK